MYKSPTIAWERVQMKKKGNQLAIFEELFASHQIISIVKAEISGGHRAEFG